MTAFLRLFPLLALCFGLARGASTLTPPASLVVEGIPPVPTTLVEEVKRYTEARSAALADWHPRRLEMLASTRFGNTAQLHTVAAPLGMRRQITFFDEPVTSGSYDPIAGEFILFPRDQGGSEFAQLYRYDVRDGAITLLTDGGRSQNTGVAWSTRGDRIAYGSTRRNGADRDLYVMDPRDPTTDRRVLTVRGGGWWAADWSPDDRTLIVLEYLSINESHLWLVDVETGRKTELTPRNASGVAYGGAAFSRDGQGVFIASDRDFEFQRLGYLDLATRRVDYLTTEIPHDIIDFDLSFDGRQLLFIANENGRSGVYLMDVPTRRYRRVEELPTGVISGARWHRDNRHAGLVINSARSPSDVYVLDTANGTVRRWTESELGGIAAGELREPELIRWRSFDGLEITGFHYKPAARFIGRRPVIISIHGGPESQSQPVFLGRNNFLLNELGVAILYPNVRGSRGFGKTFLKLDNGRLREDAVRDIGALLDWIRTQPDLDPERVMVTGGSYGGYMTLAAAVHYNHRIRCALDVVGISNFVTFLENTESYRRDLRRAEYGDERDPEMRAFLQSISPLNHAAKITKPLFIVQGANDPRVPRSEAIQMVETIRRNGGPVWYLEGKDEGHGFRKKANADFQFYATILFVRQYLVDGT
jgi:dipeptidyl aminopeptidase/acylaminoacyl peptidase